MAPFRRFDISRVRLRHYRSIAACDVRLGPLTLLVGPNGSGKSNFLDSLRLVSQALDENLDNALRERGGVAEVRRRSTGHPNHFGVSLDFNAGALAGSYKFQIAAAAGGDYRVSHEDCVVKTAEFGGGGDAHFRVRDGVVVDSSLSVALPPASSDRLYLVLMGGIEPFRSVFEGLSNVNIYNLNPGTMREMQKPDAGDLLRRDGANVASVLEGLRRAHPDVKTKIEEYLRLIVPGVISADRKGYGAWESLEFRQVVSGAPNSWFFPATSMSDGTLRALGVLTALFAPSDSGFSPIGIEEPETALHPAATGLLLEALRSASKTRQVLATSHSPDLLDSLLLQPDNFLAVRAEAGVTQIGPLDAAASGALLDSLYTAGELLRIDQLQPSVGVEQLELFQ